MERIIEARALKPSFLSQMTTAKTSYSSSSHETLYDDVWSFCGGVVAGCDDFPVEDLLNLDFNEKDFEGGCFFAEGAGGDDVAAKGGKISSSSSCSTFSSGVEDALSVGELAVPCDDLDNLEWLSQFVDDSTTSNNLSTLLCYPINESYPNKPAGPNTPNRRSPSKQPKPPVLPTLKVPRKPRNRRSRSPSQRWSFQSLPSIKFTSSSSSLSSNGSSDPLLFPLSNRPSSSSEDYHGPPAKKYKRRSEARPVSPAGRRCTHCQVQKTPQWRTGPSGPKTLCNACGVRYKSGRLFPEYLPACSPLFSREAHSNSHRKVLELRRKKEMGGSPAPPAEPVMGPAIRSC